MLLKAFFMSSVKIAMPSIYLRAALRAGMKSTIDIDGVGAALAIVATTMSA